MEDESLNDFGDPQTFHLCLIIYISNCGHRNTKLIEKDHVAFASTRTWKLFLSVSSQTNLFFFFLFVHVKFAPCLVQDTNPNEPGDLLTHRSRFSFSELHDVYREAVGEITCNASLPVPLSFLDTR